MLPLPPLFRLRPLLAVSGGASVRLAASRAIGTETVLALALDTSALVVMLLRPQRPPAVRQLDLPSEPEKRVEALCLSPCGGWLLTAVAAGALYVLPVMSLLASGASSAGRFPADDAAVYPPSAHPARPTAVAWWRRGSTDYAVIGGAQGEIEFIELGSGERVGGTYVRRAISRLDVLHEPADGQVVLLISSGEQQWRLLLEHAAVQYVVPLDALQSAQPPVDAESTGEMMRAKLNNLRQLSREKLGSLQARWAESRIFRRSVQRDETGACVGAGASDVGSSDSVAASTEPERPHTPKPESVSGVLGETHVEAQTLGTGDVLAGYRAATGTLTVHPPDLEAVPLSIHKLPPSVGQLLVTDSVIFVADAETTRLFLISYSFSQCDMDMRRFNEDCVLSVFDLDPAAGLLALLPTAERRPPAPPALRPYLASLPQTALRGCLLVTRRQVLVCEPRASPETALLQVGTAAGSGTHLLERLHKLFSLPVGRLYETLGDLKLAEREFTQALAYYRLTKKPHMAVVHKFAARGYSTQLLHYATILLSGVSEGLLLSDRRRLSDLALLAQVETMLRSDAEMDVAALVKFLRTNRHYSAGLALQLCLLSRQWQSVQYLLSEHHQHQRLLACLAAPQPLAEPGDQPLRQPAVYEPGLRSVLLARPRLAARFVMRLLEEVPTLPVELLRQLVSVTDPLSADLRPLTHGLLGQPVSGCSTSAADSGQSAAELQPLQPDDLVDLHLHVLLHLVRSGGAPQPAAVLSRLTLQPCPAAAVTASWPAALSAGFSHAALSRRGELLTWGENSCHCLGDPELTQEVGAPRLVDHLSATGVAVIQAACGRVHTLALTTAGVYAWGGGRLGQLGLGGAGSCPHPRLVPALAYQRVVRVAAGQYHSLALTDDGCLFAWGWNVFGQCGRAHVDDVKEPRRVCRLPGRVTAAAAGYAHSAVLTDAGAVLVFGCNAYGQLGDGTTQKRSTPAAVELPEPAVQLSCGYFCCVVVLRSGRVLRWGLDPQSVRLSAQTQKKNAAAAAASCRAPAPAANGPVVAARSVGPDAKCSQKTVHLVRPAEGEVTPVVRVQLTGSTPPPRATTSSTTDRSTDRPSSAPAEQPPAAVLSGTFTPESRDHLRPSVVDTDHVEGRVGAVVAGAQHVLFLTTAGRLYAQGRNLDGQLGVGGRQEAAQLIEVCVPGGRPVAAVACGADFTLVLTEDDAVLGCGSNSYGQLAQLPAADRLDDAKLVLLKNRRLLRLPQGQNSADTLQMAVTADSGRRTAVQVAFSTTERHPCVFSRPAQFASDAERLHAVLALFPGCYRPSQLLAKCLQLGCVYAAARVCAVSGQPAAALQHHLAAVRADTTDKACREEAAAGLVGDYLALADGSVAGSLLQRRLLLHLVSFWLDCQLAVPRLERLLETQLDRLAHPLAVLLFGGSADMQLSDAQIATLFGRLSAAFCIRLCSSVCEQIGQGRICLELLPVLGEMVLPAAAEPQPTAPDSVMDSVICQLLRHRETSVHLPADAVAGQPDPAGQLVVFTCGHSCSLTQLHADQLPQLRLGLSQLRRAVPRTAELLMGQYRHLADCHAACPACVLDYVTRCVESTEAAV